MTIAMEVDDLEPAVNELQELARLLEEKKIDIDRKEEALRNVFAELGSHTRSSLLAFSEDTELRIQHTGDATLQRIESSVSQLENQMHYIYGLVERNRRLNKELADARQQNIRQESELDFFRSNELELEDKVKMLKADNAMLKKKISVLEWRYTSIDSFQHFYTKFIQYGLLYIFLAGVKKREKNLTR